MSQIVRDDGFHPDDWTAGYALPSANCAACGIDLGPDADLSQLPPLERVGMIRIAFPSFSDGRGFTLARRLRDLGYLGRLRARGHVIADQYAMARRSGFDEVEISDELARRQPEADWLSRADWRAHDYRSRLKA
jgi:uncharacterized protein (DUF934 family)